MIRDLVLSPDFTRAVRRIIKKDSRAATGIQAALETLRRDAFDARLKTHKLHGKLADCWACSAGHDLRILFSFVKVDKKEAILLETVGKHDDVY